MILCVFARGRCAVEVCLPVLITVAACVLRGCGACMGNFGKIWGILRGLLVRHCIPRGFAVLLCGVARAGYLPQSNTRFDGNGGVQAAHGVTLANGPGGPDGPNGQERGVM